MIYQLVNVIPSEQFPAHKFPHQLIYLIIQKRSDLWVIKVKERLTEKIRKTFLFLPAPAFNNLESDQILTNGQDNYGVTIIEPAIPEWKVHTYG
jgi:hypothetical protein